MTTVSAGSLTMMARNVTLQHAITFMMDKDAKMIMTASVVGLAKLN